MLLFGLTGVTLGEKWTTDNVLTTQITVEDQVFKFLFLPFQKNEIWTAAEDCALIDEHLEVKSLCPVTNQNKINYEIVNLS